MNEAPSREGLPFPSMLHGITAALWHRPMGGHRLRDDVHEVTVEQQSPDAMGPVMDRPRVRYHIGAPTPEPEQVGPWLVPMQDRGAFVPYAPLKERGLLRDFEGLADDPSEEAIVRFANQYGRLGLTRWVTSDADGTFSEAESLGEWRQEALAFREWRETWRMVRTLREATHGLLPKEVAARHYLEQRVRWGAGSVRYRAGRMDLEGHRREWRALCDAREAAGGEGALREAYGRWKRRAASCNWRVDCRVEDPAALSGFKAGDILEPTWTFVHHAVNARLTTHVNLLVLPFHNSTIRYFPDSLLAALYLLFALEIAGSSTEQRECPNCHLPFEATRRDKQFCSKNCRELAGYHRRRRKPCVGERG